MVGVINFNNNNNNNNERYCGDCKCCKLVCPLHTLYLGFTSMCVDLNPGVGRF